MSNISARNVLGLSICVGIGALIIIPSMLVIGEFIKNESLDENSGTVLFLIAVFGGAFGSGFGLPEIKPIKQLLQTTYNGKQST